MIIFIVSCHFKNNREKDGHIQGGKRIEKFYDGNGILRKESVKNDKNQNDGIFKTYFKDGKIEMRGNFVRDTLDGEQSLYYENGNLRSVSYYKNGLIDSIQKWFYKNAIIKSENYWMDGRRFGVQKEFDSSGTLRTIYFISSKCDSCMTLDLRLDTRGIVTLKKGHLVSCVFDKNKIARNDSLKVLYYAVVPDSYSYNCKLIEKDNKGRRAEKKITFSNYNNNKGYLLIKSFEDVNDGNIGISISLMDKSRQYYLYDSIFLPICKINN